MTNLAMRLALVSVLLSLSGCGWLPDAYSGCGEVRDYQAAKEIAPLRVPAGADQPDTRNALKIPELKSPELPQKPGTCLEHPPSFGNERPQAPAS